MKIKSSRICPNCNNLIIYKTTGHRNDAEKHKRVCRKCQYKKCIHKPNTKCAICEKFMYKIPSRLKEGNPLFCSIACRNKYYSKENSFAWKGGEEASYKRGRLKEKERKHKIKEKCVEILGGMCSICGYNKCPDAIDFHHKNPLEKDDTLKNLWNHKWKTIETEIKKCVLLCSNCHREHHWKERKNALTIR